MRLRFTSRGNVCIATMCLMLLAGVARGQRAMTLNEARDEGIRPLLAQDGSSLIGATPNITDEAPSVEFGLGIGYAHVGIGGSDSEVHTEDALRFDSVLAFAPFQAVPQLRIAGAFGVGMVFDNTAFRIVSSGGVVITGHASVPLTILEPELRVSWRQYFNPDRGVFIEPGLGVGAAIVNLSFDTDTGDSFDESDSTMIGRVFLNIGARMGPGAAGFQASYARGGTIHLADNASGEYEEFYIGFFGTVRF